MIREIAFAERRVVKNKIAGVDIKKSIDILGEKCYNLFVYL